MSEATTLTASAPQPARRGGRQLLWLLLALFALPMATVAVLYVVGWRPSGSGSHGELVAGSASLPFAALRGTDGQPLASDALAGRWTLLVAAPGACGEACRAQLDQARRLHVALNKNMPRVRRLLLVPAPAEDPALPALRATWPDLVVAATADTQWRALLAAIPAGEVRVYVIDPEGRPVLRYPAVFDPRLALRDIERLLKLSWIG